MSGVTEININDKISDFIQKNRKTLIVFLCAAVIIAVGLVAGLSLLDILGKNAISKAEDLDHRFEELRFDINAAENQEKVQTLLDEAKAFAEKNSGYAGGRAWFVAAAIHADRKEWAEAESAWTSAAGAAAKTYLAPTALFNAAAAAEEQGRIPEAIGLYSRCVELAAVFPAAARAQFAIGRLEEGQNNTDAAVAAYREVIGKWPNDTSWTNLAQSRIIALQKGQ
jgi:TolA-binding protein